MRNGFTAFPDPENMGLATNFIKIGNLVDEISEKYCFSVMAAANLHILALCNTII